MIEFLLILAFLIIALYAFSFYQSRHRRKPHTEELPLAPEAEASHAHTKMWLNNHLTEL